MSKKSFIIHQSFYAPISYLSDNQLGQLFRALFLYQESGEMPELEPQVMMAFLFFKNQIDFSNQKFQQTCERNKNNGLKGGRPKNPDEPRKPSGLKITQTNPENPDEPLREDKIIIDKKESIIGDFPKEENTLLPKKEKINRGARLSPDWELSEDEGNWAEKEFNLSFKDVCIEADKFKDYWIAKAGAGGVKLDWQATWRNWIRSKVERKFK